MKPTMQQRSLAPLLLNVVVLLTGLLLLLASPSAAQDQPARTQRITARLQAGETHAYLLSDLQPGDRLTVSMRSTSGDLDPLIGIADTAAPLDQTMAAYQADLQRLLAESESAAQAVETLRNQYFLAWDDDSGDGYAAVLTYDVPAQGDYVLLAGSSLSTLGRATSGDYELLIGLDSPASQEGAAEPAVAPIAERLPGAWGLAASVEEAAGALTAAAPTVSLQLADLDAGQRLTAYVEATSGNLIPVVILRDFGGKALEGGNVGGQEPRATLAYTLTESAVGYTLSVQAGSLPDGTVTEGDFRVLVGVNAPDVLTGQAQPQGAKVLETPIEVQTGLKIMRISAVDSQNENFSVIGSLRMDWTDPALAFSPDSCNCFVKLYTDKEFDRFLADAESRWPVFTFFNQLGNRWIQSRAVAVWPDGRARYAENFNTTFQSDFDFRQYPFDTQSFPIYLDQILPTSQYTMTELAGYSEIDPAHGKTNSSSASSQLRPASKRPALRTPPSRA